MRVSFEKNRALMLSLASDRSVSNGLISARGERIFVPLHPWTVDPVQTRSFIGRRLAEYARFSSSEL